MHGLPRALLAAPALCAACVLVLAGNAAHAGNDTGPPTVVITDPTDGFTIGTVLDLPLILDFEFEVCPGDVGVEAVALEVNGEITQTDPDEPWELYHPLSIPGDYAYVIIATGMDGEAYRSNTVTVNAILDPLEGGTGGAGDTTGTSDDSNSDAGDEGAGRCSTTGPVNGAAMGLGLLFALGLRRRRAGPGRGIGCEVT